MNGCKNQQSLLYYCRVIFYIRAPIFFSVPYDAWCGCEKQILFVFLPINLHPKSVTETQTKNIVFCLASSFFLSGFNCFAWFQLFCLKLIVLPVSPSHQGPVLLPVGSPTDAKKRNQAHRKQNIL